MCVLQGVAVHEKALVSPAVGLQVAHLSFTVAFYLVSCENEPIFGRVPGKSFVVVEFQEVGGFVEGLPLGLDAAVLDLAELLEG
ncbi:MAG TPA: hypothetical protein VEU96_10740, partial [Bryobacteraceae bacterium]|nr:hypothetical protein [Bryobacteraceae bacterium]